MFHIIPFPSLLLFYFYCSFKLFSIRGNLGTPSNRSKSQRSLRGALFSKSWHDKYFPEQSNTARKLGAESKTAGPSHCNFSTSNFRVNTRGSSHPTHHKSYPTQYQSQTKHTHTPQRPIVSNQLQLQHRTKPFTTLSIIQTTWHPKAQSAKHKKQPPQ
jgi:hypothetical protein